jgi:transposase
MNNNFEPLFTALSDDILDSLPESIRCYIRFLENTIDLLTKQVKEQAQKIQEQSERIHELEAQISKNSSNSSKSPSSDGSKKDSKTKSQRGKSGKKAGGQKGRIGKTLTQVQNPDHIIVHASDSCKNCNTNLCTVEGSLSGETRQVFEIPKLKINVTEHRIEVKKCPCCGQVSKGSFPVNINAPVQYGENAQTLATYLKNQHLIPADRVCEIFEDLFSISLSPGTCSKIDKKLFAKLEPFEINLKNYLISSNVLHFDETGMRCEKKLHWVHVASSETATFFGMHAKRGKEAIDEFGILTQFQGTACHDHWLPYFAYTEEVKHALCNAHHLRELTFIHEQEKEEWAGEMKLFLLKSKKIVEDNFDKGYLPEDLKQPLKQEYAQIVLKGLQYHLSLPPLARNKKGKQKQRPGKNLLNRFSDKHECVLRFIDNFEVPFTNNLGERDIRMNKVKQKVSGCFRTSEGGRLFCRIRSYISTARKQGWRIWDSLIDAVSGTPRLLST